MAAVLRVAAEIGDELAEELAADGVLADAGAGGPTVGPGAGPASATAGPPGRPGAGMPTGDGRPAGDATWAGGTAGAGDTARAGGAAPAGWAGGAAPAGWVGGAAPAGWPGGAAPAGESDGAAWAAGPASARGTGGSAGVGGFAGTAPAGGGDGTGWPGGRLDDRARHAQRLLLSAVELLRRRAAGDYVVDEFGFDAELTEQVLFALLRPVYRRWFRVELRGTANLAHGGGALLVGNHSGTLAWDALMTQLAVHEATASESGARFLRPLGADLVFAAPVMGDLARRMGATLASHADAERLLSRGELVGVWPEGFKGIGKPFRDRYKLQRFGRGGFVAAAIRTRVPLVPVSIVGAEEIYPMIGDIRPLARLLGTPYWPITPLWPWFGLLGLVPLPSKWLIEFGAPIATDELDPAAADDPMIVFDVTDEVREVIQQTLYTLLVQRRSAFL